MAKLHANEADIDVALVTQLIATQFPEWANLPIKPIKSSGTAHIMYQLGSDMVARLPRIESAAKEIDREQHWLPRLAPHLPLAIPVPLAKGSPGEGYGWHWSVYQWLPGESADVEPIANLGQAASDLAHFIAALQHVDSTDGPAPKKLDSGRGVPLIKRDAAVHLAIKDCGTMIDGKAATAAWDKALAAPEWDKPSVWVHGDLLPGNLLVDEGKSLVL